MPGLPVGDIQFWIVTVLAALPLVFFGVRTIRRVRRRRRGVPTPVRTSLTIGGEPVGRRGG